MAVGSGCTSIVGIRSGSWVRMHFTAIGTSGSSESTGQCTMIGKKTFEASFGRPSNLLNPIGNTLERNSSGNNAIKI